ncbi:Rrf2 family transcriptional regulator [Collinsella sp. zg1085]|uniref:RrF2 family transcriptional regulator n=1 Tax=Collinsella sp. zg1085 TaxID=2844380 RepID=UPI001C0E6043|nr:Rrf2 family transcriptional regulator [Collinsella sp. zg1085]QWT17675.1 Rrf2 family transcriptional regulator [Collinsella sp. zg1085]
MDISRKTDYALRILAMLAKQDSGLLSVRTAATASGIPYSFARAIQHSLSEADLIESVRGVNGGMRLRHPAHEVTLRAIVEAMQGPLGVNVCTLGENPCWRESECCFHPVWLGIQALLESYLDSVTLDDVVHNRNHPAVDAKFSDPNRFKEYARGEGIATCKVPW